MTMRSVYMDYYNDLNRIEGNAQRYVPTYRKYDGDRRLEPLVQRSHTQIEQADRIKLFVEELLLVEFAGQVGYVIGQFIIDNQRVEHRFRIVERHGQTTDPVDIRNLHS